MWFGFLDGVGNALRLCVCIRIGRLVDILQCSCEVGCFETGEGQTKKVMESRFCSVEKEPSQAAELIHGHKDNTNPISNNLIRISFTCSHFPPKSMYPLPDMYLNNIILLKLSIFNSTSRLQTIPIKHQPTHLLLSNTEMRVITRHDFANRCRRPNT